MTLSERIKSNRVDILAVNSYVGDCPEGKEACHYDGNSLNNILPNLRWGDGWENARDKMRHGRERFEREFIKGVNIEYDLPNL